MESLDRDALTVGCLHTFGPGSTKYVRVIWNDHPGRAGRQYSSTSGVLTGNVLGYYRNLGSLRYGTSTYVLCRAR